MADHKSLNKIFSEENEELATIITKARKLGRMTRIVQNIVGEPLAQHCGVANWQDGVLTLYADNPAWAVRLRLNLTTIQVQLQHHFSQLPLSKVSVKVIPPIAPAESQRRKAHNAATYQAKLQDSAEQLKDANLRTALEKILVKAQKRDT